jgi:hypothetical protein
MIFIFEGARNSGKSYLAQKASEHTGIPLYKFQFTEWFDGLRLGDDSESTHLFALGKEIQLLQCNRDGVIKDIILDRGFLTVFVWGVLSGRITYEKALFELDQLVDLGLLQNCKVYYIDGKNPDGTKRDKDHWDFREDSSAEKDLYEKFISHLLLHYQFDSFSIYRFENKFNPTSIITNL